MKEYKGVLSGILTLPSSAAAASLPAIAYAKAIVSSSFWLRQNTDSFSFTYGRMARIVCHLQNQIIAHYYSGIRPHTVTNQYLLAQTC